MKNVFINAAGKMSLIQKSDSKYIGEINRMKGTGSFDDAIEVEEYNGMTAQELTREKAYQQTMMPQNKGCTIIFVENIIEI